jgi:hypothetical protein
MRMEVDDASENQVQKGTSIPIPVEAEGLDASEEYVEEDEVMYSPRRYVQNFLISQIVPR